MRELAAAAGHSTGAVFGHFTGKEALWAAAMGCSPPDVSLGDEIALMVSASPGALWSLEWDGEHHIAHVRTLDGVAVEGRSQSASEAVRQVRLSLQSLRR